MAHELKVNYYPSVRHQDNAMVKTLASIIDEIRSDQHLGLVMAIRATEDEAKRRTLKEQLPAFRPALLDRLPTGVVNFDIDTKDNVGLESVRLKACLEKIPSCIYAFESPSGGFKFGILTDFLDDGADRKTVADRYRMAYSRTLEYVKDKTDIDFLADSTGQYIHQLCYLSYDPNAYFNPDCETLTVNQECIVVAPTQRVVNHDYSDEFVLELLKYIPCDLGYDERLPINYGVLKQLGESGIAPLMAHWNNEDKPKLERNLRDQMRNLQFGSIGHLIKVAKENGYTEATGRARNHLRPKPIQLQADPLVSVEEGLIKLTAAAQSFFQGNRNVFLNVSTGAGKSRAVMEEVIKTIPRNKNVLMLVPTNALGEELMETFDRQLNPILDSQVQEEISARESNQLKSRPRDLIRLMRRNRLPKIVHIRGKKKTCEAHCEEYFEKYKSVPQTECARCLMNEGCRHLDQFNGLNDNIRIMSHYEWSNAPSAWFSGYELDTNGKIQPRKNGHWMPDYIIIDENIFTVNSAESSKDTGDKFRSIKLILDDVAREVPLSDAIICHSAQVIDDARRNVRPKRPYYEGNAQRYQNQMANYDAAMEDFSEVLERLERFATTKTHRFLLGLWASDGVMHYAPTTCPADRYANIPTLFLDATANEGVVRRFIPDIDFHRISIKSNSGVRLIQLGDTTVSKRKLENPDYREDMIDWLKNIIENGGYSNVGVITYKAIDGVDGDFDKYLANEIGASEHGHFGAIRGLNSFENADCLLIVGRHFIGTDPVKNIASAIFGETSDYVDAYVDRPVRMIDGSITAINCKAAINDKHNAINQHYCLSETIQAVGRARSIHGSKKDIYYFSNESLGLDVEVTDFFYQDALAQSVASPEAIEAIIKIGYVQDKPSELEKIGVPNNVIKNHRDELASELDGLGIPRLTCRMRDSKNRPQRVSYFVKDIDLFKTGCKIDNKTFEAFETQQ